MDEQQPKKKTNGRRNKSAGHDWEQEIARILREKKLYPHVITSRQGNRSVDAMGIDFVNREEHINGVMEDTISAKSYARSLNYSELLDRLRDCGRPHPVIFHKQTRRSLKGNRFHERGMYAITDMDTYLHLMACKRVVQGLVSKLKVNNGHELSKKEIIHVLETLGLY